MLNTLIQKTKDLYCLIPCVQSILALIQEPSLATHLFADKATVNSLFLAISSPQLDLPQYTVTTRIAVEHIYQQFTMQRALLLDQIEHPVVFI